MGEIFGVEPMQVVPDELHKLCESVRSAVDELVGAFGSLQPHVVRVEDGWVGAAGTEFQRKWNDVRGCSKVVIDDLGRIGANIEDARRGYLDVDESAAELTTVLNLD